MNAITQRIDQYPLERRHEAILGVIDFYRSLGRNRDAERFHASVANGPHAAAAQRVLAAEALGSEEIRRVLGPASRPQNSWVHGQDYVQAGLMRDAREYINGRSPNRDPAHAEVTRGQLALRAGDPVTAVKHLERGVELISHHNHPGYWWGCEDLGDALSRLGRSQDAIDRLTECSLSDFGDVALWGPLMRPRMNLELQLARLYRQNGNPRKAEEIEAGVRQRLALADDDHPLVRQLSRNWQKPGHN